MELSPRLPPVPDVHHPPPHDVPDDFRRRARDWRVPVFADRGRHGLAPPPPLLVVVAYAELWRVGADGRHGLHHSLFRRGAARPRGQSALLPVAAARAGRRLHRAGGVPRRQPLRPPPALLLLPSP